MTRVLFLFLDGVGLGPPDPETNPFAVAKLPATAKLLEGRRLVEGSPPYEGPEATILAIDARLGVKGRPQSATGQAALVTGRNIPMMLGKHYGPKPSREVAEWVEADNLFLQIRRLGGKSALLNAYPPVYFEAIESGRRLYSTIPLALTSAGLPLQTAEDLQAGRALSVDFTGKGWAAQPGFPPAPVYSVQEAGALLAELGAAYDLTWFDGWLTDYIGHRGTMDQAVEFLETFDAVLGHLVEAWNHREDLIIISSDHGNLEDMSQRGHTMNPVPALLIGPPRKRRKLAGVLEDLTSFAPAILELIFPP